MLQLGVYMLYGWDTYGVQNRRLIDIHFPEKQEILEGIDEQGLSPFNSCVFYEVLWNNNP